MYIKNREEEEKKKELTLRVGAKDRSERNRSRELRLIEKRAREAEMIDTFVTFRTMW